MKTSNQNSQEELHATPPTQQAGMFSEGSYAAFMVGLFLLGGFLGLLIAIGCGYVGIGVGKLICRGKA